MSPHNDRRQVSCHYSSNSLIREKNENYQSLKVPIFGTQSQFTVQFKLCSNFSDPFVDIDRFFPTKISRRLTKKNSILSYPSCTRSAMTDRLSKIPYRTKMNCNLSCKMRNSISKIYHCVSICGPTPRHSEFWTPLQSIGPVPNRETPCNYFYETS